MSGTIIIISNGRLGDPGFFRRRLETIDAVTIICCDGVIRHLEELGCQPDVIMGDMDSADAAGLRKYADRGIKILKYNRDKNATDTQLALEYALALNPESIEIWGALGGRIDHALANLFLLKIAEKFGIKTSLIDEYCEIFAVAKDISIKNAVGQTVSLFPLDSPAEGISLNGFKYPLNNERLEMGGSRGMSNVIIQSPATIYIKYGSLLIVQYRRKDFFPQAV
jgi:thiamine pyrophosphokinase